MTRITSFILFVLLLLNTSLTLGQEGPGDSSKYSFSDNGTITYSINKHSNSIEYPYGYSQPVLDCAQLRYSRITLQEGETINSIIIGDQRRWFVQKAWQGSSEDITPVILVKPRADDISTNLIILTNKRTYDITLSAQNIKEGQTNPKGFFNRSISFYYPNSNNIASVSNKKKSDIAVNNKEGVINLDKVDMGYRVKEGKYGFPWEPDAVYNDGTHTYIKLPNDAARIPTIYQVMASGERRIVNRAINPEKDIITIDRVFDKAVMIYTFHTSGFLGIGNPTREHRLYIMRLKNDDIDK